MMADRAERHFLNVHESVTGRMWSDRLDEAGARLATAMEQRHALDPVVARVLAGRDVALDKVPEHLDPRLKTLLPDPATLTDCTRAAARLGQAIKVRENVAIFADYDVDGATSAALLILYLRHFGLTPELHIPDRIFEGYGPNKAAISALRETGATLLVAVDCGTTSKEPLAHARAIGFDVIVLDHHKSDASLPDVTALVNPNRPDDLSGQGHLAAVGVVFITLVAINVWLREAKEYASSALPNLLQWLDLVALGSVCDVVPLLGVNRAFVTKGLIAARRRSNIGLAALGDVAQLSGPVDVYHLGYILGPRINAGGRIGDAGLGCRLLTCEDPDEASAIATELDGLNKKRQQAEALMLEDAMAEVEAEMGAGDGPAVIVSARQGWHPGLVGLVAARMKERYRRPAIAIGFDEQGLGVGSGRSVAGVDLGEMIIAARAAEILLKGGGHAMAAGLTVHRSKLGALRAFLESHTRQAVKGSLREETLTIDAALTASGATAALWQRLQRAGPFGAGNPAPIFALPAHQVQFAKRVGANHVRCSLRDGGGARLGAIAFGAADSPLGDFLFKAQGGPPIHVGGHLNRSTWQGRERIELIIADAAQPRANAPHA